MAGDLKDAATVQFRAFDGRTMYQTADPANLQAMLATQFKEFVAGHRRYDVFKPLIGRSIFSSDGKFWEHSRSLFRPQFARENINDLETTDKASSALIAAVGDANSEGWTADTEMMPLLYNFTLDTATDFLFGESVDCQQVAISACHDRQHGIQEDSDKAAKIEDARKFAESFKIINDYLFKRIMLQSFYWLGDGFEFRNCLKNVKIFTEHFVHLAVERASSTEKPEGKKDSLLNNLATQTQDRAELQNQTLAILVAGRDTTAAMLGWCLIRLALHPEVFAKLRNIVLQDFQSGDEITFAKLKGCRYLQHFLNEALRLHPIIGLNQRIALKDTTLPVGGGPDQRSPIAVRKGQIVLFSVYNTHRRTEFWGSDALEFKPERWEQRYPAWQFLPFLGGPRICLGQQFALTEASFLLVRLLQQFEAIEPVDRVAMQRMKKGQGITMMPAECQIRLRRTATI